MPIAERLNHLTLTVISLDVSVAWYERVFQFDRFATREAPGWARVLLRSPGGLVIGLTQHEATSRGDHFDPVRVGLDHIAIHCGSRSEVEQWAAHLDQVEVSRDVVVDAPVGSLLVCKDPDGIPIEFLAPVPPITQT